jgi:hypothetical protein
MFPGVINGHGVRPNIDLIEDETLSFIKEMDNVYREFVESPPYKNPRE